MADMLKITCPNCQRTLDIPEELTEFSCLYCGGRFETTKVLHPTIETPSDFEERFRTLLQRMPKTVTRYPDYYKRLSKKDFFHSFEVYENENRALLREMDGLLSLHPEGKEAAVGILCGRLMDALTLHMEGDKRWGRSTKRSEIIFEVKVVLAIFLTPTVRKLKLSTAELFRTELHRHWMERYPKEKWEPGDYEVMASGFKRTKWCYITTATCLAQGKPDDCAELCAFRSFRDGWLTEQGGTDLIAEYYDMAPGIVACIDLCDEPALRYEEIRSRWLQPCYEALQKGDMEQCRDRYVDMVRSLQRRYLQ